MALHFIRKDGDTLVCDWTYRDDPDGDGRNYVERKERVRIPVRQQSRSRVLTGTSDTPRKAWSTGRGWHDSYSFSYSRPPSIAERLRAAYDDVARRCSA